MPADFDYPVGSEAWAPLDLSAAENADRARPLFGGHWPLKSGTTMAQAQADLQTIAARLAQQYPQTNAGHRVRVVSLVEDLTYGTRQFLSVLMGAAVFVLLLACANVANLQLARATARQKNSRCAAPWARAGGRLHASYWRKVSCWPCWAELAGVLFGRLGKRTACSGPSRRLSSPTYRESSTRRLIPACWLSLSWLTLLTGILAGLAPALHVSNPDPNEALKEGSRGRERQSGLAAPARAAGGHRGRARAGLAGGRRTDGKGIRHSLLNRYPGLRSQ